MIKKRRKMKKSRKPEKRMTMKKLEMMRQAEPAIPLLKQEMLQPFNVCKR
jgi:hypothetical protein